MITPHVCALPSRCVEQESRYMMIDLLLGWYFWALSNKRVAWRSIPWNEIDPETYTR